MSLSIPDIDLPTTSTSESTLTSTSGSTPFKMPEIKNVEPIERVEKGDFDSVDSLVAHVAKSTRTLETFRSQANDRLLLNHLVAFRVRRGLSQKEMALRLGKSQGTISKLESGRDSTTEIGIARQYARAIGLDISLFVTRKDTKLADLIKIHTMTIRKLLDRLMQLTADDETINNGTRKFASQIINDHLKPLLNLFEMQIESAEDSMPFPNDEIAAEYVETSVSTETIKPELVSAP